MMDHLKRLLAAGALIFRVSAWLGHSLAGLFPEVPGIAAEPEAGETQVRSQQEDLVPSPGRNRSASTYAQEMCRLDL